MPLILHDLHDSQMFAIAQAAGRAGIPVDGTFWPMEGWGEKSRYVQSSVELPCLGEQLKGTYALSLKNTGFTGVWLPCVDDMADFTARYQEMLRNIGFRFITADADTIASAFATESFPQTTILKTAPMQNILAGDLYGTVDKQNFPLLLKTVRDHFEKFEDAQSLRNFLGREKEKYGLNHYHRVQQFIEGGVEKMASAILLFDEESRPVRGFTGRRLRVVETAFGPFGETTAAKAEWIPELYEGARELLSALHWKGFAEVECKQGEDGIWYVMEINPRLSGWTPLAEADGAGLISAYYQMCADGVKLEEACLQRSKADYVRIIATSYHDPDWAVGRAGNKTLWQQIGSLLSTIKYYRKRRPDLVLGAWDDLDLSASLAIFQSTIKRFWKKRRLMRKGNA
ncbi:MAG TPA: hypothetical protein VKA23_04620 [Mariprofundaceae bacterium]|nr:hypothetical protein [Mariprofundaceae bacterium]